MGRYGSGITFKKACALDREQIVKALNGEVVCGEDENGFLYESSSKEEGDKRVLEIFDGVVYEARQTNAFMRAQEKYFTKQMGKRKMKLFQKGFFKSGYLDHEMLEEFEEEYQNKDSGDME